MSAYTSGIVRFGIADGRNPKTINDLSSVVIINYLEMSKRQRDLTMMDALGHTLSLKIKIPKNPVVNSKMYAVIEGVIYSVSYIDKYGKDMFVYLEAITK